MCILGTTMALWSKAEIPKYTCKEGQFWEGATSNWIKLSKWLNVHLPSHPKVFQCNNSPNHHRFVQNSASVQLFENFTSINVSQRELKWKVKIFTTEVWCKKVWWLFAKSKKDNSQKKCPQLCISIYGLYSYFLYKSIPSQSLLSRLGPACCPYALVLSAEWYEKW